MTANVWPAILEIAPDIAVPLIGREIQFVLEQPIAESSAQPIDHRGIALDATDRRVEPQPGHDDAVAEAEAAVATSLVVDDVFVVTAPEAPFLRWEACVAPPARQGGLYDRSVAVRALEPQGQRAGGSEVYRQAERWAERGLAQGGKPRQCGTGPSMG